MRRNNNIYMFLAFFALLFFQSCEKEGDKLILSGLDSSNLLGSQTDIVLTSENKDAIMLALTWDESELSITDPNAGIADDVPGMVVEVSNGESFESFESFDAETNMYEFSGSQLNTLAKNLGFEPDKSTPMYFRMKSSYGPNTDDFYSNTVVVNVTCFAIDMTKGFILNADQEDTGFYLYSPDSDGDYYGFTSADGWFNWYLKEGDGTIWGNYHDDNGVGTEFLITSQSTNRWNFWYPGKGGCYYTTLSTSDLKWTATYIPDIQITGDVTGEMTFDKTSVVWSATIITTTDNSNVKVSCNDAALYNMATGTADENAIVKEIGFVADASGSLTFEESAAAATNITIETAGTYTLKLNLADPMNWYFELTSGEEPEPEPEPVNEYLYLIGIDDGRTGSDWNFNNTIGLLSADDLTYAGVVDVNSAWGYKMAVEDGNWDDVYAMGASEGTLVYQSSTNITAPAAGLYLIQADLTNLTYSHTAIGNEIYLTGLNDVWNFTDVILTASTSDAGVYTGTAQVTGTTTYGVKVYLDTDWTNYLGGSTSDLVLNGGDAPEATSLTAGTYNVTVDLINGTCNFEAQ